MQLPDMGYSFGRVMSTEAVAGPSMPGAILVYVYRYRSAVKELPDPRALAPDTLLVPPMMTNRLGWSRGYFETLTNWPIGDTDVLPRHCFEDSRGRYLDEHGNQLEGPVEPMAVYGLYSYRMIDDVVSEALGFPGAPD